MNVSLLSLTYLQSRGILPYPISQHYHDYGEIKWHSSNQDYYHVYSNKHPSGDIYKRGGGLLESLKLLICLRSSFFLCVQLQYMI